MTKQSRGKITKKQIAALRSQRQFSLLLFPLAGEGFACECTFIVHFKSRHTAQFVVLSQKLQTTTRWHLMRV